MNGKSWNGLCRKSMLRIATRTALAIALKRAATPSWFVIMIVLTPKESYSRTVNAEDHQGLGITKVP